MTSTKNKFNVTIIIGLVAFDSVLKCDYFDFL